MMYHLIEIFKERDDFADELSKRVVALRPQSSVLSTIPSEHGPSLACLSVQRRIRSKG